MTVTSLDAIVNNLLLQRRYSLHWYLEFLLYCKQCLEELSLDGEIDTFRYVVLPINDNHAIEIPNDYVDWVRVSSFVDGFVHPLVPDDSLNLVPNYNTNFDIQPYSSGIASLGSDAGQPEYYPSGTAALYFWANNWNMFGENLGRQFGGSVQYDTFRVNKLRNEIKINELFNCSYILLEYEGNGSSADNATNIDVRAASTIREYAMWKFKENNRTYSNQDAMLSYQQYTNERAKLRARTSDLTIDLLRRIVQKNSVAVK